MDPTVYAQAIKDIESSGGDYGAVGPVTDSGDRAYGAYQVMGSNIPDWTQQHYGKRLTPAQFLQNKDAQDAVFHGQFGSYVNKYGNPQDAASAWFSGRPLAQAGNASDGGLTVPQYVDKFNRGIAKYSKDPGAIAAINAAAGIKPGTGALAFSGDDDASSDDDTGSLSANKALGPGALKDIVPAEAPNKLNTIGAGLASIGASLAGISSPAQAAQLNAQAAAIKKDGQSTYKYMMGADGTLYRMDDQGGISAIKTGSAKAAAQFKSVKNAQGGETPGVFDPNTKTWTPIQVNGQAQAQGLDDNGLPETFADLQKLDPSLANQVQGINSGAVKLPTSSYRNPQNMRIRNAVFKYFPNTSEDTFNGRNTYAKNFGTDQPSQPGGQSVGLGHSLQILDQLGQNYAQQNNWGPMLGAGTTLNEIKNAQTFGGQNAATAANGADLAYRLSTETGRLYSGNQGGGVKEREDTMARFGGDTQNLTPIQQAGRIRTQRDLLTSRQEELERQRDNLFGNDPAAAQRYNFRNEETQAHIDSINKTLAKLDPNGPEARAMSLQQQATTPASAPGKRPPLASFF